MRSSYRVGYRMQSSTPSQPSQPATPSHLVRIIIRIKNQRPQFRTVYIINGWWDTLHHRLQYLINAQAHLGRRQYCIAAVQPHHFLDFPFDSIRVGTWEVDFVQHWNDFQFVFQCKVDIGECLCLHTLWWTGGSGVEGGGGGSRGWVCEGWSGVEGVVQTLVHACVV